MPHKHDFIKHAIEQRPQSREALQLLLRKHVKARREGLPNYASLLKAYRELLKTNEIEQQIWLEQLLVGVVE